MTSLRRVGALEYFRAVEVQKRGALHLHVIVWSADPLVVGQVQELALAAGFGCVLDVQPVAAHHAHYVAKYSTKSVDQRDVVPWRRIVQVLDVDTGELLDLVNADPTFRTWSASQGWGLTVRDVLHARRSALLATQFARAADAASSDPQEPATAAPPAVCPEPAD